jgi:glutamine synthetase
LYQGKTKSYLLGQRRPGGTFLKGFLGALFVLEGMAMSIDSREEVLEKARESNVKFIRLQFTDIFGSFKNIAITIEELERALDGKVLFDSSAIEGFVRNRESDISLLPDPDTFEIFPWRPRDGSVARLICDVCLPDGSHFPGCSRSALKRVLKERPLWDLTCGRGRK